MASVRKKTAVILMAAAILSGAAASTSGCAGTEAVAQTTQISATAASTSDETTSSTKTTAVASEPFTVNYSEEDLEETWDAAKATMVVLSDDSIKVVGSGAAAEGSTLTITAGGVYVISGSLDDGQIIVEAKDKETVRLVLDGASITCSDSAPIYVKSAQNTIITLAEGTNNSITDGTTYAADGEETDSPNAAIYCTTDLTINGTGSLTVDANYKNGIIGKDELKLINGNITVDAVGDAIRGRDSIGIKSGTFNLAAGNDGIQSNNGEGPERGYIAIDGGSFTVTADNDGIQAETTLLVTGGEFDITSGGGSANGDQHTDDFGGGFGAAPAGTTDAAATTAATGTSDTSDSAKALKAGVIVAVIGGNFAIDSADDAIHSDNEVTIEGGTITLASGDDAIHAETSLQIAGGETTVTKCYEGLESAEVTIDDGTVRIVAEDDGINTAAAGQAAAAQGMQQGPGQESGNYPLYINGGYVSIDASGDGIDVLGPIEMTGGTVIVNGPANDGNGALDYQGELKVTGGYLIAVGSSGMAQAPSESSSQYSLMVNFTEAQAPGTIIHIEGPNGEDILTIAPSKQFQSVVMCSDKLQKDATYKVYLGGSSTGTLTDTVYSGGTYTPGTENTSLTLSAIVTTSGATGGMGGPGQGRKGPGAPDMSGN